MKKTKKNENTQSVLYQFRRSRDNGIFSDWEELPPKDSWDFIVEFLDGYHGREDVEKAFELACVLDEEEYKDWKCLYENYPEYKGLTIRELKKIRAKLDKELFKEAIQEFNMAKRKGEIEIRDIILSK